MSNSFPKNSDNYKPVFFPQSLKVIKGGIVNMETEFLIPKILEFEARKVVGLGNIGEEHVNIADTAAGQNDRLPFLNYYERTE